MIGCYFVNRTANVVDTTPPGDHTDRRRLDNVGDMPNDIQNISGLTVQLRAERSGKGKGRDYTITVQCKDASGNASTKTTTVTVKK
jgi:hypothetical protein